MKYLTLTIIICMCSCVRLPSDFEYNLRIIADTNEQMLMHIKEMDDKEIQIKELIIMVETDIKDFRNAAATVEAGR